MFLKILIFSIISNALQVYTHENQNLKVVKRDQSDDFKSCFENLGCLDTTEEWYHHKYRPRNLEPLDRHTIRTEFILITKDIDDTKPLTYETLTTRKNSVAIMGYKTNKPLVILIHDFTSNGKTGWVKHLATALLNRADSNVVSVDWEAGAEPPFEQAIANARVVALEIKFFIEVLKNSSSLREDHIHIIGHGVGAHIAGYVGTCLGIGRITGLDPTGPFFENMPAVVRLDPDDAGYVEVLHTDAFNSRSQGSKKTFGHVDFFLNDAKMQPECNQSTQLPVFTKLDRNILKEGVILPACSHKRAFKYYIEAVENTACEFTGIGCGNYERFAEGKCTSCHKNNLTNCATFGLVNSSIITATHSFYLNTRGEPPFCLNSYRVKIYMENNSKANKHQEGSFELIMLAEDGTMLNATASYSGLEKPIQTYEAGKAHTFIYYASEPRIEKIIEARLKWVHNPNSLCFIFCTTSVYVNRIVITLLSANNPRRFPGNSLCAESGKTKIENGSYVVFTKCGVQEVSSTTTETTHSTCKNKT